MESEPSEAQREALKRYLGWRMKYVTPPVEKIAAANMNAATNAPTPGGAQYISNIRGLWQPEEMARNYVAQLMHEDPRRFGVLNDFDRMLEANRKILIRSYDMGDEMHRLMGASEIEQWRRKAITSEVSRVRATPNQQALAWWSGMDANVKAVVHPRIVDALALDPSSYDAIDLIEAAYRKFVEETLRWWNSQDELLRRFYTLRHPDKHGYELALVAMNTERAKHG
jgi:hypothetical protein